jgi:hypothetical protein
MVAESGHSVADELATDTEIRRAPMAMGEPVLARRDSQIRRPPSSSGLYDVLDLILDKGIVIDAFVRVSLVGIELLTVDLRVVIASVDTYLRYAEGAERLQVYNRSGAKKLPNMVGEGVKSKGLQKGAEKVKEAFGGGDDDDDEEKDEGEHKEGLAGALTHGVRHILKKGVGGILHNIKGDSDEGEEDEHDEDQEKDEGEDDREEQPRGRHGRDRDSKRATAGSRR